MPDEIVLEGFDELFRTMEGLSLTVSKKLIVNSLRKGSVPILNRAKELAPDDPLTPRSHIAESMTVNVREHTATGATAAIGPTSFGFMGIFAELGTAHQPRRGFLLPAFDQKYEESHRLISDVLGAGIDEAWAK